MGRNGSRLTALVGYPRELNCNPWNSAGAPTAASKAGRAAEALDAFLRNRPATAVSADPGRTASSAQDGEGALRDRLVVPTQRRTRQAGATGAQAWTAGAPPSPSHGSAVAAPVRSTCKRYCPCPPIFSLSGRITRTPSPGSGSTGAPRRRCATSRRTRRHQSTSLRAGGGRGQAAANILVGGLDALACLRADPGQLADLGVRTRKCSECPAGQNAERTAGSQRLVGVLEEGRTSVLS